MSFARPRCDVASKSRIPDDGTAFETRNPSGANPRGLRDSDDRRLAGDSTKSPASLDPALKATGKSRAFDESNPK